ncbi:MAG: ABC transporter permease [Oscillospiraceae bacterium]|jgi:oligopeptide transport system permease protein|nr:ABC transporter permease [Oscillospiraceae bacterium]
MHIDPEAYANLPAEDFAPLGDADRENEQIARPSTTYWQDVWARFRRDPLAMAGLCVLILVALAAIFGPMLSPFSYEDVDFLNGDMGPSSAHWFGTDRLGRDIFVRVLYGARISLTVGVVAAVINLVIGVLYGGIAGFIGRRVDMVLMRIVDILIGLPSLLYIILIMMALGSSIQSIVLALCFTSWIGTARVVRSEVMMLKSSEYALAARLTGASDFDILLHHLIPNCMGPIIVSTAFLIPSAIFSEAFLAFLGIGIQVPMASWGTLANEAIAALSSRPYQMFFPVAAICVTMFSLNFIGDGLRDALDPRLKK